MKTISINGQAGSFHEQAIKQYLPQTKAKYCETFKGVFKDVMLGRTDSGLVAIENSLYGSINEVDALLLETGCKIIGEYYLRIEFALIGQENAKIDQITDVYSQDIALSQCHKWLDENMPKAKLHNAGDTAGSVALVNKLNSPNVAAVASIDSAKLYGMHVIAANIENDAKNFTRFAQISKSETYVETPTKTSIVLKAANKPGSLYEVLGIFKDFGINLTKLDSKPIAGQPWQYMFYIDFEAGLEEVHAQELLSKLDADGHNVHVLGTYQATEPPKG